MSVEDLDEHAVSGDASQAKPRPEPSLGSLWQGNAKLSVDAPLFVRADSRPSDQVPMITWNHVLERSKGAPDTATAEASVDAGQEFAAEADADDEDIVASIDPEPATERPQVADDGAVSRAVADAERLIAAAIHADEPVVTPAAPDAPVHFGVSFDSSEDEVTEAELLVLAKDQPVAATVTSETDADIAALVANITADPTINRLAEVPDATDDEPVVLPPIAFAEPETTPANGIPSADPSTSVPVVEAPSSAPVESVPSLGLTAAAVAAPMVMTTTPPAALTLSRNEEYIAKPPPPVKPLGFDRPAPIVSKYKKKRHPFRALFKLVLVLALVGGGLYAAKVYVLDKATWSDDVKVLADEVAEARGLTFDEAVEVVELPADEYAAQLATSALDLSEGNVERETAAWRAVGLLTGPATLAELGQAAVADSPAFYNPADETIYVVEGLTVQLETFAVRRALTQALLDQEFDWGSQLANANPSVRLAVRAWVDADALSVAATLGLDDSPEQLGTEIDNLRRLNPDAPSSPYAADIAGRPGVSAQPTLHALRGDNSAADDLLRLRLASDAGVFNPLFGPEKAPQELGANTRGMMFWYYALAGRIGSNQAWDAMLGWNGDVTTVGSGAAGTCVNANITAVDDAAFATLVAAFNAWSAASPAEAKTSVTSIPGNTVTVNACDPGVDVPATNNSPIGFGGAPAERALMFEAEKADPGYRVNALICLLATARAGGATLNPEVDTPPIYGNAYGWVSGYARANLDLAEGCKTA